jgi:hypothetical protein
MKDQAAATPTTATEPDPRLTPVLNDEKNATTPVKLGRIESKRRGGQSLTAAEPAVLETLLEHLGAQVGRLLHEAVVRFAAWCDQQVRDHGGRVEWETHRIRNGRRTIRRHVDHFPAKHVLRTAHVGRVPRLEAQAGRRRRRPARAPGRVTLATMA